jgi:xanthine phosphoribosyltransferase
MQILEERIQRDAKHLGDGIVKVDSFMNHQIDPILMQSIGEELARRLKHTKPTKIVTAETSGIAPALITGLCLKIPIVFARKHQPITMAENPYRETSTSATYGKGVNLLVSSEYLSASDRVLIIDDFLSSSKTIISLIQLVEQSGAALVGIGFVIEKAYKDGRKALAHLKIPIESLAVIDRCEGDRIILNSASIHA